MNIEILAVYKNLKDYILAVENDNENIEALWEQYAIAPYWGKLCQYAPMDLSDRKPKAIKDIETLKKQLELMEAIDLEQLKLEMEKVTKALPNYDDDPMYIAIYPLSDTNQIVKERQNGVVGASTFGNMIINVNPFVEGYYDWILYVFAHEYHHNVWGNYWFGMHGGELKNQFIESLLIDGEADSFALSLYPELKPKWLFDMTSECEEALWKNHYSELITRTDVNYPKYMFGDEKNDIPWCAGYTIGFRIMQSFIKKHPEITFSALLERRPMELFEESGYLD
ncbi:MAG: hypothetical protein E7231_04895 [Cellulosilyticum sp.]|nr:hypothetical protein [Cellulosilyticum sp.]